MSLGGTNPGWFQGIDPRGGADFDENGPNLTEDISFEIRTTLVRIEGPEELHSSGIESKTGERSEMISSWCRAAVEHTLAKANDSNADGGPVLKVRESADQSIIRLVSHSHGRPRRSEPMGGALSPGERETGLSGQQTRLRYHRLMDKPSNRRLIIKEAQ